MINNANRIAVLAIATVGAGSAFAQEGYLGTSGREQDNAHLAAPARVTETTSSFSAGIRTYGAPQIFVGDMSQGERASSMPAHGGIYFGTSGHEQDNADAPVRR